MGWCGISKIKRGKGREVDKERERERGEERNASYGQI